MPRPDRRRPKERRVPARLCEPPDDQHEAHHRDAGNRSPSRGLRRAARSPCARIAPQRCGSSEARERSRGRAPGSSCRCFRLERDKGDLATRKLGVVGATKARARRRPSAGLPASSGRRRERPVHCRASAMSWSAAQYVKFEEERTRPVRDLVAAHPRSRRRARRRHRLRPGQFDRGPARALPGAAIVGIDSSPDMIDAARKRLPDVAFEVADIAGWAEAGFRRHSCQCGDPVDSRPRGAANGADRQARGRAARSPSRRRTISTSLRTGSCARSPLTGHGRGSSPAPAEARAERKGADWYFRLLRAHAPPRRHLAHDLFSPSGRGGARSSNG